MIKFGKVINLPANAIFLFISMSEKIISGFIFLSFTGLSLLHAQVTVPAAGGNASGSGGSVSYTVGQPGYTTITGANGSVAMGVQQPYEISVIISIKEAEGISLHCSVYPNPATDILVLKIGNFDNGHLYYKLFDITGKIIENKKIESAETTISTANFKPSTYLLKVLDHNKEVKTFKIVKN